MITSGPAGSTFFLCKEILIPNLQLMFSNVLDSPLQGISSVKAAGPHAIQGKWGMVKTPLTNQAINHLAVSGTVTHSG